MGDLLAGLPLGQIGAGTLLAIVVLLILTGRLVPQSVARDALEQRDKALELADAHQKVSTEQGMTLHQILDAVEKTTEIVTAIQNGLSQPASKGPRR